MVHSSNLHLKDDFPATNIFVRNPEGEAVRSLYMTNDIVKSIVQSNDYSKIRLMTCGTKVMGRQEGSAAKREGADPLFRVLSEGLPVMLPYIKPEFIIRADLATLKILMEAYYPVITGFPGSFRAIIEGKGSFTLKFIILLLTGLHRQN